MAARIASVESRIAEIDGLAAQRAERRRSMSGGAATAAAGGTAGAMSADELGALSRAELQALAKAKGVKANQKSEVIIEQLMASANAEK